MAVGGLTGPSADEAVSIVSLGLAMQEEASRHVALGEPVRLRIGVHSGPAVGGVIGTRKLAFDLWGDTVNVASRIEGLSEPGRVLVSEATWQLVGDHFECAAQADTELRGHAPMRTYSIIRSSGCSHVRRQGCQRMIGDADFGRVAEALPMLLGASPDVLQAFRTHGYLARIPAGRDVFVEGDEVGAIPLLISGTVRVYQIGATGREVTLYRFRPGKSCVLTANAILTEAELPGHRHGRRRLPRRS